MPLILPKQGIFEIEEKKSRFIAVCAPVETEPLARAFIAEISTQHKDANHNVFAYSVNDNIIRFNDDGEPNGSAGMPVLNVYTKAGVVNFVCVVTRYFGGTLLGAGGLVRAYTKAAKGAMQDAVPEELIVYKLLQINCTYPNLDKIKYDLQKADIEVVNWEYTEKCQAVLRVTEEQEGLVYENPGVFGVCSLQTRIGYV